MNNYELLKDIRGFYHNQLKKSMENKAIDLLEKYEITSDLIDTYMLGLNSLEDNLEQYLIEKGYSNEEISNLPLFVKCDSVLVNATNEMIMIPVNNLDGQCCAFLGVKEAQDGILLTQLYKCSEDNIVFGLDNYSESSQVAYLCSEPFSVLKKNINKEDNETVYCFLTQPLISCVEANMFQHIGISHIALRLSSSCDIANIMLLLDYEFNVSVFQ